MPREQIFLTTKLNNSDQRNVAAALDASLKALDTPYLDLWLMHWPCPMTKEGGPDKDRDWRDTWKDMEKVFKEHPDKVKAIGVSNFSVPYLQELLKFATVVPAVNQIESHPYVQFPMPQTTGSVFIHSPCFRLCMQEDIVEECKRHGIVITSYSPLGSDQAPLLEKPVVKELAEKYKAAPSNILISLQVNRPGVTGMLRTLKSHLSLY